VDELEGVLLGDELVDDCFFRIRGLVLIDAGVLVGSLRGIGMVFRSRGFGAGLVSHRSGTN
jgi:hypothetical protein